MRSITFLRGWQGRQPGSSDSRLTPGVMATLVQIGVARWADQMVGETLQQTAKNNPSRGRKRR